MLGSRAAKISNGVRPGDVPAGTRAASVGRRGVPHAAAGRSVASRLTPGAAFARWVAWTTPGILVSRIVVLSALIAAPWVTTVVYVEQPVRYAAAALLLAHLVAARLVVRRAGRSVATAATCIMLVIDAVLSGVLIGAACDMRSPAIPVGLVVLAIGFQAGGWRALLGSSIGIVAGIVVTAWSPLGTPLLFSPAASYATALRVDTSFAGSPAVAVAAPQFPSVLDPDTSYAGTPGLSPPAYIFATDLSVDTTYAGVPSAAYGAPPMLPVFALAFVAVWVGGAVSLLRTWREVRAARRSAL